MKYLVTLLTIATLCLLSPLAWGQDGQPDPVAIWTAATSHAWPVLTGLILAALVYLAHLPAVAGQLARLPALALPAIPIVLGLISGVAQALRTSQSWGMALLGGALSALPALAIAYGPYLPSATAKALSRSGSPNAPPPNLTSDELADAVLAKLDVIPAPPKVPTIVDKG